jgi:hypothetical protein
MLLKVRGQNIDDAKKIAMQLCSESSLISSNSLQTVELGSSHTGVGQPKQLRHRKPPRKTGRLFGGITAWWRVSRKP